MGEKRVVICGVARTPIGRFNLSPFSAVDLGVASVKELLKRTGIDPESGLVEEVTLDKSCKQEQVKILQGKLP